MKRWRLLKSDESLDKEDLKQEDEFTIDNIKSVKRTTHIKKKKHPDVNCIYLLKLLHPRKNLTYLGSTKNFYKRLGQHNGSGGAKYTRNFSENHKYLWTPILVIEGVTMTKSESLQFEYRAKYVKLTEGKQSLANNAQHKEDGKKVRERVRKMLIVANLKKWSKKCVRDACDVPLTVKWYMPREMPSQSLPYLPEYVSQEIVKEPT